LAAWKLSPGHKKQRAYQKKRSNSERKASRTNDGSI
jgi:hypothetical protein